jgi:large subunit ribosomal protein L32e
MNESHEHHAKDAKKDDKKEEKKEGKKVLKKEVHKHGESAHAHEHDEPARVHKQGEPAHAPRHTEPTHVHEHGAHKPVEAVKKVEAPAPRKPEAAPTGRTAKDLADEIEKELAQGQPKAAEGEEGANVAKVASKDAGKEKAPSSVSRLPSPEPPTPTPEPEVEIVEDESETKKEVKGQEAKEEPKEAAKEEAKEEKKKGKKAGKLKGKKKKKKQYRAQPKAELSVEVRKAMELRRVLKDKTPDFIRQESYNYGRLGENWRKPRGKHSKLRHHISYRINVASIGYGGPGAARGLHPSGFREVLVHHPRELDGVNPKTDAARVAHGVGSRKREMIQRRAERMGIRILNEIETA